MAAFSKLRQKVLASLEEFNAEVPQAPRDPAVVKCVIC